MKTSFALPTWRGTVLVLICSCILLSCATWLPMPIPQPIKDGKPPVVREDGAILVPRALHVSPADLKTLNGFLAAHSKKLFKVAYYENGKRTKTVGTLGCAGNNSLSIIDEAAQKSGASDVAVFYSPKSAEKGKTGSVAKTCYAPNKLEPQAEDLRAKVYPILKKYAGG